MDPPAAFSIAELDAHAAELLPARRTLCGINVTNVIAINIAIAINAASIATNASAVANQQLSAALH
jgi:hypothetical protein